MSGHGVGRLCRPLEGVVGILGPECRLPDVLLFSLFLEAVAQWLGGQECLGGQERAWLTHRRQEVVHLRSSKLSLSMCVDDDDDCFC